MRLPASLRRTAPPLPSPAVSSLCGSADVLEALGVAVEIGPEGVARCIEEAGVGFMFAPTYHPAMKASGGGWGLGVGGSGRAVEQEQADTGGFTHRCQREVSSPALPGSGLEPAVGLPQPAAATSA